MKTAWSRYDVYDPYTIEELRRDYEAGSPPERIALCQRQFTSGQVLPYEVALLAVADPDLQVRRFLARSGQGLDYRELVKQEDGKWEYVNSERNLYDRLLADTDPMVRASVFENPHVMDGITATRNWEKRWAEARALDRLAFVRNPQASELFVKRLFDPDDTTLQLDLSTRADLCFAVLTNEGYLSRGLEHDSHRDYIDGFDWYGTIHHCDSIWNGVATWPEEYGGLKHAVYARVICPRDVEKIFHKTENHFLRKAIVSNPTSGDRRDLIKVAMSDPNPDVQTLAYSKVQSLTGAEVDAILKEGKESVLIGLASNTNMSEDTLEKVAEKLGGMDKDVYAWSARQTLKTVREKKPPEDPTDMFRPLASNEEPSPTVQIEKLNAIGKRVLAIEEATGKLEEEVRVSLRELQAQMVDIGKAIGYIITGGIVLSLLAFSTFAAPSTQERVWLLIGAGVVLWIAFRLIRGAVRVGRGCWKDEGAWDAVCPYLLGLAALVYAVGWWMGYFPSPQELAARRK